MSPDLRTQGKGKEPAGRDVLLAGRYEVLELIGRGSMASVYRGRDVVLDRQVAIKLFRADTPDATDAARFEQEARLLARLNHSSLVTVFDAGIDAAVAGEKQPYLVMELIEGESLSDRLRDGPLPPADVAVLASQIASALAYVHRRGIVHRDVKPANIILPPPSEVEHGGVAKLADFGIARLVDGAHVTLTGYTIGTANYISPEQLNGDAVGPPSDVYSLGLVLLECLTGAVAFPGHGVEAAMPRLHRPPALPAAVPDGWGRLLRTMTDMQPENRPSAAEVGVGVIGLADDESPAQTRVLPAMTAAVAPTVATPIAATPVARSAAGAAVGSAVGFAEGLARRRWPFVAAGLAIVVLAIILGVALNANSASTPPSYPPVTTHSQVANTTPAPSHDPSPKPAPPQHNKPPKPGHGHGHGDGGDGG